jgi:outer membrane protein assembly factor BamA
VRRFTQFAALATLFILTIPAVHAQQGDSSERSGSPLTRSCSSTQRSRREPPSGPEISIAQVIFPDSLQLSAQDQQKIAASVEQQTYEGTLDAIVDEAMERARQGWQNAGYFKVKVSGDSTVLTSNAVAERIAISLHVDEGQQYRLAKVIFKHNEALRDTRLLRNMFPIHDGDIFSRDKIAEGLNNLRNLYSELGYLNFTIIPDTDFDDEQKMISLDIDLDEGKPFRVGRVEVLGLDETQQGQLQSFPFRGQTYNARLIGQFLVKGFPLSSACMCTDRRLDETAGSVALTFDFRPCSARTEF